MSSGLARLPLGLLLLLAGCDGTPASQAPPLDPPDTRSAASGGACEAPDLNAIAVVLFSADRTCIRGDVAVLYRCSPSAAPVLRLSSETGPVAFVGGPFALPVTTLPANVRFVASGEGMEVLIADAPVADPIADASASPAASVAGPEPVAEPLVYVRHDGVTERWLRLERRRALNDPPVAWLVGDSILDGGRDAVEASLSEWDLTLDAVAGRPSSFGIALADEAASAGADVVLIELGTNDSSSVEFRDHLLEILDILRDVPLVLWQTARGPEDAPTIPAVNDSIREVVPSYPNTAIADWEAFVPPEAVLEDGIHPDEGFETLESELLIPLITAWRDAVSGGGASACGPRVVRATS